MQLWFNALVLLLVARVSAQCPEGTYRPPCVDWVFDIGWGGCDVYATVSMNVWCVADGACEACCGCANRCTTHQEACVSIIPCVAGFTGAPCAACLSGTYKNTTGSAACISCPVGKYGATAGATSASACLLCPSNSDALSASSAASACKCNAGYSGPDGGSCSECPVFTYKKTSGSGACDECPHWGSHYNVMGATTCLTCPLNAQWPGSWMPPTACVCLQGYTGLESTACSECVPGQYTGPDDAACSSCVPGKHKETWAISAECTACEAGKYSQESGATNLLTCVDCPSDATSRDGSSICTCNIGYSGPDGGPCIIRSIPLCSETVTTVTCSGTCSCAGVSIDTRSGIIASAPATDDYAGLYPSFANCQWLITGHTLISLSFSRFNLERNKDFVNIFRCTSPTMCTEQIARLTDFNVPTGVYTSRTGYMLIQLTSNGLWEQKGFVSAWSATCEASCGQGYTGPDGSICSSCTAGNYKSVTGSTLCTACPTRKYGATTGLSACTDCPAGKYADTTGLTTCAFCAAGTYGYNTGLSRCAICSAHVYQDTEGSTGCKACETGKYNANVGATACTKCTAGTYASSTFASACTNCSAGMYVTTTGATVCSLCAIGKFSETPGLSSCTNCSIGTYHATTCTTVCMSACIRCPVGTYGKATGITACVLCEVGTYAETTGLSACVMCAVGTYAGTTNHTACMPCAAGTYAAVTGISACRNCPVGTFYTTTGASVCNNCPVATYRSTTGATFCVSCPPWSTSDIASTSIVSCVSTCNFGYTGPDNGTCAACISGTYKDVPGPAACVACAVGTYENATGSVKCKTCVAGGNSSLPGSVSPTQCCGPNSLATVRRCTPQNWARSCGTSGDQACSTSSLTVYMSYSSYYGPQFANDGLFATGTAYNYVDNSAKVHWWQVNFSKIRTIQSITIYSGSGGILNTDFAIELSNDGSTFTTCASGQNSNPIDPFISDHTCEGSAQFLRISIISTVNGWLMLKEVEVPSCQSGLQCLCNAGYTGPTTADSTEKCTPCAAGTYKNTTGSMACTACPNGTYTGATGAVVCMPCGTGAWAVAGSSVCLCTIGYGVV